VDEAAVIELFVARVAAIIVGGRAAEGIGIALAIGQRSGGVSAFTPRIEGLTLSGGGGEGFGGGIPSGGEEQVSGAEVIGEDVGEFYGSASRCDGTGVNDGTKVVAVDGFGGDGGGEEIGSGGMNFPFVAAKV
jgi:hypothetical protein